MHRRPVPLSKAYRLLNHGPTVMVTSAHAGRRNVMSAAWNMPLDFSPPKVAVVIDKSTYSRQLIEASGVFGLNVPCRALAQAAHDAGQVSGRDLPAEADKFQRLGLQTWQEDGQDGLGLPMIEGCVAWLACRVLPEPRNEQVYDLFLAEVVGAWADERVFADGHWLYGPETDPALRTLHYVAGGHFLTIGEPLSVDLGD
ncbi:MAG: flavin reductase family protein [Burkholderiales bacterium]|nr:flavin reductase family protein [Burkholderiales bacterium]